MLETSLQLIRQRQTYLNLLYLLVSLPLGLCSFLLIIIGIAFTAFDFILIGIPFMILFLTLCWRFAAFERTHTMAWLHVDIPPMAMPFKPSLSSWQRFLAHMTRPVTWKSMLYLLLKFPFGIIGAYAALTVLLLSLLFSIAVSLIGFLIAPFVYVCYAFTTNDLGNRAIKRYLLISLTGNGFAFTPFIFSNILTSLWGQFARLMLGMSDKSYRLAQATALAEQERAKAERAEQSRSALIVNVSHELRTPVASIRGHIESLLLACDESEGKLPSPELLRNYLTIVHRESLRLGALFDDLLSVARAETNQLRVTLTAVDAAAVIEEVYQTLMPLARRERQIAMVREVVPGLPPVQADRQRLTQVLLNLVRNAITYTPDGGIISISLQPADPQHLDLAVADTGIGIPPEDQERIFERFYRTDASRARTSGGFGLGLAIVRDFVIAMGGSITVESTVGAGSCFHVLLPISP